jgi:NAD(P)-dependent dehydrogenase (short-subunit alcohol dehydrogenase family)
MPSTLITGANRGLGLEFVRQYAADGWQVYATCRDPNSASELRKLADASGHKMRVLALDVTDLASVKAAASELDGEPIDLLLNNAGVGGARGQTVGNIDYAAWAKVLDVNTLGPLRISEAFVGNVARSQRKIIVTLTSGMGSIADKLGKYWIDTVSGSRNFYRFWYDARAGEIRRRSLETADFEQAKVGLAALVLAEGEAQAREPKDVTLITVLNSYWTEHSDHKANPSAARRTGELLLDYLGNAAKVSHLTKAKQRGFIAHLRQMNLSVGYISRVQAIIAAALNRAKAEDDDDGGMLLRVPRIIVSAREIAELLDAPEPQADNWHPTLDQIAAFMDAVKPGEETRVLRYALLTMVFAGRPEAVRELRTDQFDERHGLLQFNALGRRQTKNFRPTVTVPPRLLMHMEKWAEEAEWFVHKNGQEVRVARKPWAETLKRAGLPASFTPKSLRHFMATEMRKRGVSKEQREEWMGHRRHSTNDAYGQFSPDFLRAAKDSAEEVLAELEALCERSIYRDMLKPSMQVSAKSKTKAEMARLQGVDPVGRMVGGTGIEPVTPTMST